MTWTVGDRVRNIPDLAHLWEGTPWAEKLARPRLGTVLQVPWFAANTGAGTLFVEWDSLGGGPKDPKNWQMWIHSTSIERV